MHASKRRAVDFGGKVLPRPPSWLGGLEQVGGSVDEPHTAAEIDMWNALGEYLLGEGPLGDEKGPLGQDTSMPETTLWAGEQQPSTVRAPSERKGAKNGVWAQTRASQEA